MKLTIPMDEDLRDTIHFVFGLNLGIEIQKERLRRKVWRLWRDVVRLQ